VRVKVKVVLGGEEVVTSALVNSGFESERPQPLVPYGFLAANNVDPSFLGRGLLMEYDTVRGPTSMFVYIDACNLKSYKRLLEIERQT